MYRVFTKGGTQYIVTCHVKYDVVSDRGRVM